MRTHAFLKVLNDKLATSKKIESEVLGLTKSEKKSVARKSVLKLGMDGKLDARGVNVFDGLTVFGLTEHHLSKESIECLEVSAQGSVLGLFDFV
jgi:hypothetical protein